MSWAAVFPVVMFLSKISKSSLCDSCEVLFPNVSMGAVAFGQANARRTCEAVPAPSAAASIGSVHPACVHNHDPSFLHSWMARLYQVSVKVRTGCISVQATAKI